ncbi:radical SAM protein [Candidatus Bipolaricaulota bacterium]|nr:radical SAM protein [Candidatus Bipolaricaulota bacterium]
MNPDLDLNGSTRVREIEAKTLVSRVPRSNDGSWYRTDYNMNVYRGCQHRCIYCNSRSACYRIDRFDDEIVVKKNAVALLEDELRRKRNKGIVGTGSMSDPYMPLEGCRQLTRQCLAVIARYGFGVHIHTKSDLVVRDLDLLTKIRRISGHAVVAVTLTTGDDNLAAKVEPFAPSPSRRLAALKTLAASGIETWVTLMPVLPFIEDNQPNLLGLVHAAADAGVFGVFPFPGMTLRDRQRAYYYEHLAQLFPGFRELYARTYGSSYICRSPDADRLMESVRSACRAAGMKTRPIPEPRDCAKGEQLSLL